MLENDKNTKNVFSLRVSCSGETNNPSEGHPLVWLQIDEEVGYVICPYCEMKFVYQDR
jgi:uncharacterized Zn-finger protein|tara:strand:- start:538 stop:711 length:174 start_codon:yes stop_codon:yes gene_type:complete